MRFISLFFIFAILISCALTPLRREIAEVKPAPRTLQFTSSQGAFTGQVRWTVDPFTAEDVLEGQLSFLPAPNLPRCQKIGWIQAARVSLESGEPLQWTMGETPRNILATQPPEEPGFYIDHLAAHCRAGQACSPYFSDHWPQEGRSAFGRASKRESKAATLVDFPFGWTQFRKIELEACAVCADTRQIYACLHWGGEWPAMGQQQLSEISFTEEPSSTYRRALERFEKYYKP